jgi:ribose 5-phosphate isomerase B
MKETIPIAADHAGFEMKERLVSALKKRGYEVEDLGAKSPEPSDYPDYAHTLAQRIESGEAKRGVLLCGSGIGMEIAANRHKGVRASVMWTPELAELARKHNDLNVLVLPSRFKTEAEAEQILDVFLNTEFEGGRHQRRVAKIEDVP